MSRTKLLDDNLRGFREARARGSVYRMLRKKNRDDCTYTHWDRPLSSQLISKRGVSFRLFVAFVIEKRTAANGRKTLAPIIQYGGTRRADYKTERPRLFPPCHQYFRARFIVSRRLRIADGVLTVGFRARSLGVISFSACSYAEPLKNA